MIYCNVIYTLQICYNNKKFLINIFYKFFGLFNESIFVVALRYYKLNFKITINKAIKSLNY